MVLSLSSPNSRGARQLPTGGGPGGWQGVAGARKPTWGLIWGLPKSTPQIPEGSETLLSTRGLQIKASSSGRGEGTLKDGEPRRFCVRLFVRVASVKLESSLR